MYAYVCKSDVGHVGYIFNARFPMMIGTLTMIFCRIALAYVLSVYFDMGMFGTWVAMFIDWVAKALIFLHRYFSGKWTEFRAI